MSRWSSLIAIRSVIAAYALSSAGCSFLVEVDAPQCETHAQCVEAELGERCVRNVCVHWERPAPCTGENCDSAQSCTSDRQCTRSAAPRCMRGGCVAEDVAERFLCESEPEPTESDTVKYSFKVIEFVTRSAPANLVVSACQSNDPTCAEPVATFTDEAGTGQVMLELPRGFLGFFEVTSDALTALSYITKALDEDRMDRLLQVSAKSTVDLLSTIDGTEFDPEKGLALVEAFECSGSPAGGVHFEESRGTAHPFYIVNHTPNSDVTASVYDPDNDVADGGFINIEPGFVTFRARFGEKGPLLGEFNAQVRANTITFVDMYF